MKFVTLILGLFAFPAIASPAQTFKTVVSFDGSNGSLPLSSLVQGTDGFLYGTTDEGGAGVAGSVFRVNTQGKLAALFSFCGDCSNGGFPTAGLVQVLSQGFYGTTSLGGGTGDAGTAFKIGPAGELTTLYRFCSLRNCADGTSPLGRLILATDGNLYGTTSGGGANCPGGMGCGTVFELPPSGTMTTLYNFCAQPNCTDGSNPGAGLVQATNGSLYGTTVNGGANGQGIVFRITMAGELTVLYSFCSLAGCVDGMEPSGALIQGADGNFYGTTFFGGAHKEGTVFKITDEGKLTVLHSFCSRSGCPDGANPASELVQATDGLFYGTTSAGILRGLYKNGNGTVFSISATGDIRTLHRFDRSDGAGPVGGLVQATNGKFYGTTPIDGPGADGTIFSVSVGLGPFVETQPSAGGVGKKVIILGSNLEGATGVAFKGTPAKFKVVSGSEITTSVPQGATTGFVNVTTPARKLKSNTVFRVTK